MPAKALARKFRVPADVVTQKQGVLEKHVSAAREMPSEMAARAGELALARAKERGIDSKDIGLVTYVGSQWKDYHIWLMGAHLQDRLGIPRAFAFDTSAMCAGVVFGLHLAKNFLGSDSDLRAVLLVGASKESYIVRATDPGSLWMDDFADAGVAAVVARDRQENFILGSDFLADGSLSLATLQRGGGARQPVYPPYARARQVFLEGLISKEEFRRRMDAVSLGNFADVIERSIRKSGLSTAEIRMLFLNHMKRSFHRAICDKVGIPAERAWYLERFGHSQSADQILGLDQAIQAGTFDRGPVVMAAAGTGYVWGSTVVRWG